MNDMMYLVTKIRTKKKEDAPIAFPLPVKCVVFVQKCPIFHWITTCFRPNKRII